MQDSSPVHFLNLEYFMRRIYDAIFGAQSAGVDGSVSGAAGGGSFFSSIVPFLTSLWMVYTIIAYLLAFAFMALFVYSYLRLQQVIALEQKLGLFATLDPEEADEAVDHNRWRHVMELIESPQESDWRQAIIEADIMLFDMLGELGYIGDSVGDRLKQVNPARFHSLDDAWEAHKVRNEIAHQGSSYRLTDHAAYRTIQRYEAVFREHNEI